MRNKTVWVFLAWLAWQATAISHAERKESGWLKIGVMGTVANIDKDEDFDQLEIFLTHSLPWMRDGEVWDFFTQLDLAGGAIADDEKETYMGSIGPRFVFHEKDSPLLFDIGIRATFLGDDKLGTRDVDGPFHFTSHFRMGLFLPADFELGVRIQHMSNAGLSDKNPGLDLVVVDIGRYF